MTDHELRELRRMWTDPFTRSEVEADLCVLASAQPELAVEIRSELERSEAPDVVG